jgi:metal-responsive CopG/Arc/MetJ family transcriptional regulator
MKNITISMPDELARKVGVMAAKEDVSMSQFFCKLVEEKTGSEDGYRAAMESYLSRGSRLLRDPAQALPKREELYDRAAFR